MPISILMPALSPTMTEGNLVAWHKQEGDTISPGEVIAEIETDKATMEVEAVDEGKLGKILISAGTEGVAVNTTIGVILEDGETLEDVKEDSEVPKPEASKPILPNKPEALSEEDSVQNILENTGTSSVEILADMTIIPNQTDRVFSSPLARRMAEQAGIDIGTVKGSGPNGRIIKDDIDSILKKGMPNDDGILAKQLSSEMTVSTEVAGPVYEANLNTPMRKVIARRLTESKQTAPHFYMVADCEIDTLLETRSQLNEKIENGKISVNDLIIRASALALKLVPMANASWTEEETRVYKNVDISVAVAIDGGLITPIVKDAGNKGLKAISEEMKDLAERAKSGKLMPEEYQGGTFSISNLGMYGVKEFSAVINPPQGAILAVGMGEKRPVVKDNALSIATIMTCTLSVDHRVVDGAVGAQFLSAFKKLIEDPLRMLL
ncbi:pyruvate dehydrogenase complex dihydrolipoamide acetyltransferase [Rhodospirillaceae bacterium]|jgi:pyruvate dehydrogenase E2 component (dihydrolipoamide acetyltransferase)|nr:pyruvate dehydrogenase complex dihydrolipoamide acetyltransferase [Rhodospirillaceae bacterium]MDC1442003.1 pyruvate dehydrogenase complex dihydrolipoamide acetyltransferase [Rhodospirillaceae bacterium]